MNTLENLADSEEKQAPEKQRPEPVRKRRKRPECDGPSSIKLENGQRFERLTVLRHVGRDAHSNRIWECRCDCGNIAVVRASHLKSGFRRSCGCLQREQRKLNCLKAIKHDHCFTPVYQSWTAMKFRCSNAGHEAFPNYGGRGIFVCEKWKIFEGFFADMGERPAGTTLDRIDNSLGYFKENCRWATWTEQGRNRRTNRILTAFGVTKCLSEWAEFTGIGDTTIRERLRRGWSIERALS